MKLPFVNMSTCNHACLLCPGSCLTNDSESCLMEWRRVPQSEWNRQSPELGPQSSPLCTAPIQFRRNWIILSLSFIHLLQEKLITFDLPVVIWVCVCVCAVCVCVFISGLHLNALLLIDISELRFELGSETKIQINLQLNLSFPTLHPSFLPHPPFSHLFCLIRTWSQPSSSSAPPSSRRLCWCWTSWRSTTGTSSPLSHQSSLATRSSSISWKPQWTTGRMNGKLPSTVLLPVQELRCEAC